MLTLELPEREYFDEETERFGRIKATTLKLEHSLISISKWEAKWHISFFDSEKTTEQTLDYIRCMVANMEIPEDIPSQYEKWHINRLIMLIRVCSEENKPKKKMSRREIMAQNKARNAARRAKLGTRG